MKYMTSLVLSLPELFPEKQIPVLMHVDVVACLFVLISFFSNKSTATFTARQSACLIACGFFCLYPQQVQHRRVMCIDDAELFYSEF